MKVPVRRLPETRASERQQGFARAVPGLDISPITTAIEGFQRQLADEQKDQQKFDANKRLMKEINELQLDFEERQRDPEISPDDFANSTNAAYQQRHQALLEELRGEGFDRDVLNDLDLRLGTVRQGFFEKGLGHQFTELRARAGESAEDLGREVSAYISTNHEGYASGRDMLRENIARLPGLTEQEREALLDEQLGIARDTGKKAMAIQAPQAIIDLLDPQGLTAPRRTTMTAASSVNVGALDGDRGSVATVLSAGGLSAPVVAGFLGNFDIEDGYSGTQGDGGTASGIAQWRKERRDNFKRKFGKDPHEATKEEQAQFVLWELDNPTAAGMTEAQANSIRAARTAEEAAELIDKFYERSSGEHRSRRKSAAMEYARQVEVSPSASFESGNTLAETIPQPKIPGNLPLNITQVAHNSDGTVSTVRTISIGTDKGEVLIPTVIGGKVVSDEEAIRHYKETDENFGTFETEEEATAFAQALHQRHETELSSQGLVDVQTGNALIDDMNGPERIELLMLAREHLNKVNASRKAEMDVTIGNITAEALNNGGEIATPLPTQEDVIAVYGAVEGPQRWAQIQKSKDVGKSIVTFRTQSATDIQRGLDAIRPVPGSPTYQTQLQIYNAAETAAQHLLKERHDDPASYALKYFPSVAAAAKRGTSNYYAALDRVYETLGIDSSRAPLMSGDAARQITQDYKLMSPAQKLDFMKENFAGMGEDRFRRFVSNMEGTTAQDDARIYALLRTYPRPNQEWALVYQQVLEGREIMTQDPARRPSSEDVNKQFRAEGLSAITNLNADASAAIQESAAALYVARGGDPKTIKADLYRKALETALGGSLPVNMRRGDVKDYTILPPRTTRTSFQNWIERQTFESLTHLSVEKRPPRYGDLKTLVQTQDIVDEGVFVMVSPGRYMIKMASDGKPVMTSTGRPFLVNIRTEDVR